MEKMIFTGVYLIIILLSGSSCIKEQVANPSPNDCDNPPCDSDTLMGQLDTLWTAALNTDGIRTGVKENLQYFEGMIFATFYSSTHGRIVAYDANSIGSIIWEYDKGDRRYGNTYILSDKNLLINKSWRNRLSLEMDTGNQVSYVESPYPSGPRGIVLDNYLYFDETEDNERTVHLRRSPVSNLSQVETVYTIDNDDINNSKKSIESMNLWLHPSTGDSILIFQHRMLDRVDVVAWNMDKQEVVWRHDDLSALGNSNHQQITLHNDKAYFGGATAFYCFDMLTGEIVWQYDHPSGINSFLFYKPVIAEDENAIVVKDGSGQFRAFDFDTGKIKMFNEGSGHSTVSSGSPIYHKGIIYFTEKGLLYAVRVDGGKTLWSESSSRIPMGATSFQGELAIDRERGILYATDDDELFAIKVYEE